MCTLSRAFKLITCLDGHTESIHDFFVGVEQSHISANDRRHAEQHDGPSSGPEQHVQHCSDTQAGQILTPCDYK